MKHLTFYGVGAHLKNGVSERILKELNLSSRTLVLHAQRYWPEYITTMLLPFDFAASTDRLNNIHVGMNGKTPEIKFQTQLDQLLG